MKLMFLLAQLNQGVNRMKRFVNCLLLIIFFWPSFGFDEESMNFYLLMPPKL